MPNKTINDDVVKCPPKKKYTCKKNKGEHEYLTPTLKYEPSVKYIYDTGDGILYSPELKNGYKYLRTELSVILETRCKYCGHKCVSYLTDKLK